MECERWIVFSRRRAHGLVLSVSDKSGVKNENVPLNDFFLRKCRFQTGMLGAIQVDSKHLGKGYGSIVCRAITKKLAELGEDAFACVGEHNIQSNRMFSSTGFKVVDKACWLRTLPTIPFHWVDDENE